MRVAGDGVGDVGWRVLAQKAFVKISKRFLIPMSWVLSRFSQLFKRVALYFIPWELRIWLT